MGSNLTIKIGVGIEIPWLAEGVEVPEERWDALTGYLVLREFAGDRYVDGFYKDDLIEDLEKRFPLLSVELSYVEDYVFGGVLLVPGNSKTSWDGVTDVSLSVASILPDEEKELRQAAKFLGLEYNPQVFVLASFG